MLRVRTIVVNSSACSGQAAQSSSRHSDRTDGGHLGFIKKRLVLCKEAAATNQRSSVVEGTLHFVDHKAASGRFDWHDYYACPTL